MAAALLWAGHGAAMAQSVERGAALYAAHCSSCHSPDQHGDGPAHRGVVGRRAGALKDFDYSPALRASKLLWTRATLKAWLTDPEALKEVMSSPSLRSMEIDEATLSPEDAEAQVLRAPHDAHRAVPDELDEPVPARDDAPRRSGALGARVHLPPAPPRADTT